MNAAKSAEILKISGATLIACCFSFAASAGISQGDVQGITQGDAKGITQGDVRGITQGDMRGITQGDIRGITQGDIRGITQGDIRGITQGDIRGITQGDIRGITQGDIRGITQGDIRGITQGDIRGITQGDIRGITQGDIRGITQGDIRGITQGDIRGITQGDIRGITQGDIRGITQGDIRGITQGDIRGITQGDIRGITQGDLRNWSADLGTSAFLPSTVVLAGPVDSIDRINGVFTSLGQTVIASQGILSGLSVGDYVAVDGSVAAAGWLFADRVSVSRDMYVPGASEVFVTGMPSSFDYSLGRVTLGDLSIDFNAALGGGALPSGAMYSFRGVQPNARGLLVSDEVAAR